MSLSPELPQVSHSDDDSLSLPSDTHTPPPNGVLPDRHRQGLLRKLGVERSAGVTTSNVPNKVPFVPTEKNDDLPEKMDIDEFIMFESPIESSNKDDFRVNYLRKLSYL